MNKYNECKFFRKLVNGKFCHITCRAISQDNASLDDHNYEHYEHVFFYQGIYFVTCELLSPSLIVNILNRKVYGMDLDVNNLKQKESLSLIQKLSLEQDLKQVLPFYLEINGMNSFHGHEHSMANSHLLNQNGVGSYTGYTHNVTHPQQQFDFTQHITNISAGSNSFHNMTTRAVSMTDAQTDFNNGLIHQNGVGGIAYPQQ